MTLMIQELTGSPPAGGGGAPPSGSTRRKLQAVLRLIRGEDLELVSREVGVTAATLSTWR